MAKPQQTLTLLLCIGLSLHFCSSYRVTGIAKANVNASLSTSIDPFTITSAAVSTVSMIGSVYSLLKTRRLLHQNEEEKNMAQTIVDEYLSMSASSCRVLDQVDRQLHSQRVSTARFHEIDPHGNQLSTACGNEKIVKSLQDELQQQFHKVCADVQSDALPALRAHCDEIASTDHVESLCSTSVGDASKKFMRKLDFARVRLDGLLAGLCDNLPGFVRLAPKISLDSILEPITTDSSFLEGASDAKRDGAIDWLGIIGLAYSAIGTVDFALDMYDTAVNTNQGYGLLLDFVRQQSRARHEAMCESFSNHLLRAASIFTWVSSMMRMRFTEAGLYEGRRYSDMIMLDWNLVLEDSDWVCDHHQNCLVPAELADVGRSNIGWHFPPEQRSCHLKYGHYYRLCGEATSQVTAVAPEACFSADRVSEVEGRDGKTHTLRESSWVLRFRKPSLGRISRVYSKDECDKPFQDFNSAWHVVESVKEQLKMECKINAE